MHGIPQRSLTYTSYTLEPEGLEDPKGNSRREEIGETQLIY
jgi:hypothetical protein